MKYDSLFNKNKEIDLKQVIKALWKKKILILLICSLFLALGLIVSNYKNNFYNYNISIKKLKISSLMDSYYYKNYYSNATTSLEENYNEIFLNYILDENNLLNFIKEHEKEYEVLFALIQNNNFQIIDLISVNLKKNKKTNYQLEVTFHKKLNADLLMENYLTYVKKKKKDELIKTLLEIIDKDIENYKRHLKIAKDLKFENPIPALIYKPNSNELFLLGSIMIAAKIKIANEDLKKIANSELDYDLNMKKTNLSPVNSKFKIIILFFFLGLLTSLIIVFFKKR